MLMMMMVVTVLMVIEVVMMMMMLKVLAVYITAPIAPSTSLCDSTSYESSVLERMGKFFWHD